MTLGKLYNCGANKFSCLLQLGCGHSVGIFVVLQEYISGVAKSFILKGEVRNLDLHKKYLGLKRLARTSSISSKLQAKESPKPTGGWMVVQQ